MKILVLSGSRNRQGKTALAIDSIRKGVVAVGGESRNVFSCPNLNLSVADSASQMAGDSAEKRAVVLLKMTFLQ